MFSVTASHLDVQTDSGRFDQYQFVMIDALEDGGTFVDLTVIRDQKHINDHHHTPPPSFQGTHVIHIFISVWEDDDDGPIISQ